MHKSMSDQEKRILLAAAEIIMADHGRNGSNGAPPKPAVIVPIKTAQTALPLTDNLPAPSEGIGARGLLSAAGYSKIHPSTLKTYTFLLERSQQTWTIPQLAQRTAQPVSRVKSIVQRLAAQNVIARRARGSYQAT